MHIVPPLTDLDPVYRPLRPLFIDMVIPTYCNFRRHKENLPGFTIFKILSYVRGNI